MSDILRMEYINSLPQPFIVEQWDGAKWPLIDLCVETGCLRFDVCGMIQPSSIGEIKCFIDACGNRHDPETFYSDFGELI